MIWIGGLVTTYRAGMAVPDGFSTYGYPLFTYPLMSWLAAPWELFIEHGHRLWGYLVGISTISFVAAIWLCDRRRWMRWLAIVALLAVVGQGVLGAMRVRFDEVLLARIHGCVGPAFFALTVALAVFTSRRWCASQPPRLLEQGASLQRLAIVTTALAYLQLVLGSALRHMPVWARPGDFRLALVFHLIVAAVLAGHVALLAFRLALCRQRNARCSCRAWPWPRCLRYSWPWAWALGLSNMVGPAAGCRSGSLRPGWRRKASSTTWSWPKGGRRPG